MCSFIKINEECFIYFSGTVDEHFAKALGSRTWNKVQIKSDEKLKSHHHDVIEPSSVDAHFAKALGSNWQRLCSADNTGSAAAILK